MAGKTQTIVTQAPGQVFFLIKCNAVLSNLTGFLASEQSMQTRCILGRDSFYFTRKENLASFIDAKSGSVFYKCKACNFSFPPALIFEL